MTTDEDKVADFARVQLARYSAYHAHKESMAYLGLALFAGLAGTILVSDKWPPADWGDYRKGLACFTLSLAWLVMLGYLRFQLRRRRWAALRMAACEQVLAKWATGKLKNSGPFPPAVRKSSSRMKWYIRFFDLVVYPCKHAVEAIKGPQNTEPIYPEVFVRALESVEESSTDAISHERLMHITGWGLFVATIVRTIWGLKVLPPVFFTVVKSLKWP